MQHGIELEVEDLINVVFVKNVDNVRIDIALQGIEHQYDLFCFCSDLLTKGLVKLYGADNALNLDEISHDQFTFVQKKMACAGIQVDITSHDHINGLPFGVFFPKQNVNDPADHLTKYNVRIHSLAADMVIGFSLIRNI